MTPVLGCEPLLYFNTKKVLIPSTVHFTTQAEDVRAWFCANSTTNGEP